MILTGCKTIEFTHTIGEAYPEPVWAKNFYENDAYWSVKTTFAHKIAADCNSGQNIPYYTSNTKHGLVITAVDDEFMPKEGLPVYFLEKNDSSCSENAKEKTIVPYGILGKSDPKFNYTGIATDQSNVRFDDIANDLASITGAFAPVGLASPAFRAVAKRSNELKGWVEAHNDDLDDWVSKFKRDGEVRELTTNTNIIVTTSGNRSAGTSGAIIAKTMRFDVIEVDDGLFGSPTRKTLGTVILKPEIVRSTFVSDEQLSGELQVPNIDTVSKADVLSASPDGTKSTTYQEILNAAEVGTAQISQIKLPTSCQSDDCFFAAMKHLTASCETMMGTLRHRGLHDLDAAFVTLWLLEDSPLWKSRPRDATLTKLLKSSDSKALEEASTNIERHIRAKQNGVSLEGECLPTVRFDEYKEMGHDVLTTAELEPLYAKLVNMRATNVTQRQINRAISISLAMKNDKDQSNRPGKKAFVSRLVSKMFTEDPFAEVLEDQQISIADLTGRSYFPVSGAGASSASYQAIAEAIYDMHIVRAGCSVPWKAGDPPTQRAYTAAKLSDGNLVLFQYLFDGGKLIGLAVEGIAIGYRRKLDKLDPSTECKAANPPQDSLYSVILASG